MDDFAQVAGADILEGGRFHTRNALHKFLNPRLAVVEKIHIGRIEGWITLECGFALVPQVVRDCSVGMS
ncbi:hypothetical protein D3C77_676630 [compost metagenome]